VLHSRGFIEYREAAAYVADVEQVVDELDKAFAAQPKQAAEVVELCEFAVAELQDAYGNIDDSDGGLGMLQERIEALHLKACTTAKPDPAELARRLLAFQLNAEYGAFATAAEIHTAVLGETGLAEYRRLAEAEWAKLKAKRRNTMDSDSAYALTRIMESLARASGDLDALIAVKSRDLSHSHRYLDIAAECLMAREERRAEEWVRKGLAAFPDDRQQNLNALRTFLADLCAAAKRYDEALPLLWRNYEVQPCRQNYEPMQRSADRLGVWAEWRDKAIACLRQDIVAQKAAGGSLAQEGWHSDQWDGSRVVEILLWEKREEEAWAEAQSAGCRHALWLELAKRRQATHPDDAVAVYERVARAMIEPQTGGQYDTPVRLLDEARRLRVGQGREAEFRTMVARLGADFTRKRRLIETLRRKGWLPGRVG
jgi:uncharacterized Zn finger protein